MYRPDRHLIEQTAQDVRIFLESIWPVWHASRRQPVPMPASRGTCQTSSLFLAEVLRLKGIEAQVVQGNDPAKREGYRYRNDWHGHAWVELPGLIVDVTGDQFDLPAVHITEPGSPCYRPGADTASYAAKQKRAELVAAAVSAWKASL